LRFAVSVGVIDLWFFGNFGFSGKLRGLGALGVLDILVVLGVIWRNWCIFVVLWGMWCLGWYNTAICGFCWIVCL